VSDPEKSPRFETGNGDAPRRAGDAHVDRAGATMTSFDEPFQTFITEGAWGSVWSRPNLTRRERSIVTLALLAALGHDEEVAMHTRADSQYRRDARGHKGSAAACGGLRRRPGGQSRVSKSSKRPMRKWRAKPRNSDASGRSGPRHRQAEAYKWTLRRIARERRAAWRSPRLSRRPGRERQSMTISPLDSPILSALLGDDEVAAISPSRPTS